MRGNKGAEPETHAEGVKVWEVKGKCLKQTFEGIWSTDHKYTLSPSSSVRSSFLADIWERKGGCSENTDWFRDSRKFHHLSSGSEGDVERKERNQNKGGKGGVDNLGVYVISIPQSKLKEEILIGRDGKNHAQCDKISWWRDHLADDAKDVKWLTQRDAPATQGWTTRQPSIQSGTYSNARFLRSFIFSTLNVNSRFNLYE